MNEKIKDIFGWTMIIVIGIGLFFGYQMLIWNRDKMSINKKMKEINGSIVKIEPELNGLKTPFYYKLDGDRIYKINYKIDNQDKIAYVKMNALDTWLLDYDKS